MKKVIKRIVTIAIVIMSLATVVICWFKIEDHGKGFILDGEDITTRHQWKDKGEVIESSIEEIENSIVEYYGGTFTPIDRLKLFVIDGKGTKIKSITEGAGEFYKRYSFSSLYNRFLQNPGLNKYDVAGFEYNSRNNRVQIYHNGEELFPTDCGGLIENGKFASRKEKTKDVSIESITLMNGRVICSKDLLHIKEHIVVVDATGIVPKVHKFDFAIDSPFMRYDIHLYEQVSTLEDLANTLPNQELKVKLYEEDEILNKEFKED